MSASNDGGPAFPTQAQRYPDGGYLLYPNGDDVVARPGLSLRDYFAGQALVGLSREGLMNTRTVTHGVGTTTETQEHEHTAADGGPAFLSRIAYRVADAMLKERDRD